MSFARINGCYLVILKGNVSTLALFLKLYIMEKIFVTGMPKEGITWNKYVITNCLDDSCDVTLYNNDELIGTFPCILGIHNIIEYKKNLK